MSNEEFDDLVYATRITPDDGCDWAEVIVWEMRSKARLRTRISTVRPVPKLVIKLNRNTLKKSGKTKRDRARQRAASLAG